MKILNLKGGIRDTIGTEKYYGSGSNRIAANTTFQNYIIFITEGVTSKRSRQEIFNNFETRQVSRARRCRDRGRSRGLVGRGIGCDHRT